MIITSVSENRVELTTAVCILLFIFPVFVGFMLIITFDICPS